MHPLGGDGRRREIEGIESRIGTVVDHLDQILASIASVKSCSSD